VNMALNRLAKDKFDQTLFLGVIQSLKKSY